MRAKKGSKFERTVCKALGKWWTAGARDDIFWRSAQSGGRATQRRKKGLGTYGSYGDIAAVDPIGEPLLKAFTLELKRGSTHKIPGDLVDCLEPSVKHSFAKALLQAMRSAEHAGTPGWMLICQRDHRCSMVYFPTKSLNWMPKAIAKALLKPPSARYKFQLASYGMDFLGMPLQKFLNLVSPNDIKTLALPAGLP